MAIKNIIEKARVGILLGSITTGLLAEFIFELSARAFIIWFSLTLFAWSILAMAKAKSNDAKHDDIYAICSILLVVWYSSKIITLKEKKIGDFADNCRKEELLVGTIVPISVGVFAIAHFLSSI